MATTHHRPDARRMSEVRIDVAQPHASTSSATGTGRMEGREVRREAPNCCSVIGWQGWGAMSCLGGGGSCLVASGYMPTTEWKITCGLAGLVSNLVGLGVGGRTYYVARLAESLAEGIARLQDTEATLRGTVGALEGRVQGLREAIVGLQATSDDLEEGVGRLRKENETLTGSNAELTRQIVLGHGNIQEQREALEEGQGQIEANVALIKERQAQSKQAGDAVTHFEGLLAKARSGFTEKKAELDEITGRLEQVSEELEAQLLRTTEARKDLELRIPQLEEAAVKRAQAEGEAIRDKLLEDTTAKLGQMRLEERLAAIQEAKGIRDEGALEVTGLRESFEKERLLQEQGLQERGELLTHDQEAIAREREQMEAQRAVFVKREEELLALLAQAKGDVTV